MIGAGRSEACAKVRSKESDPSAGDTSFLTILASKASPASPSPAFPSRSLAVRPRARTPGPNVQQREVAGAAAKVANQDQLIVHQGRLVGIGRADGLVLEGHGIESRLFERRLQSRCSERIVLRSFSGDEAHGPSDGRMPHGVPQCAVLLRAASLSGFAQ